LGKPENSFFPRENHRESYRMNYQRSTLLREFHCLAGEGRHFREQGPEEF